MFIFLAFFTSFSNAIAQSCNTELKVSKNRNARSANEQDATQFYLELINNSSTTQTYSFEVANYDGSFLVRGKQPEMLNSLAQLDVSIRQNNIVKNSITVPARSTVEVQAHVAVQPGTPMKKWAGLELRAISNACTNGAVSTLLKLYVTDPTEE